MKKWDSQKEAYEFVIRYFIYGARDVSSIDIREALDYCANEKNANAQYIVYALEYEEAIRNHKELSLDNLRAAAAAGIPGAQYDLGLHLFYGEFVEKDIIQGLSLMELAASQGYLEACRTLYRIFSFDSRVRNNPVRAEYWKDKLEGGTLAEQYTLHPLSEKGILIDAESKKQKGSKKADHKFGKLFLTVKQDTVIMSPYRTNLIVNAGPGTGKTYALIQRIAYLVRNENINPENIAVFSFTRAVVKELKTRLAKVFEYDSAAYLNVDISTFHKKAYAALQYANQDDALESWQKRDLSISNMYYDDCMVYGEELLEKHPEIISSWEYVIIDEIQDINHAKAHFVLQLIEACKTNHIPYMLLGDSCQSIYDYLDSNSANRYMNSSEFYENIIQGADKETKFYSFDINENFRSTEKIKLQALPVREALLGEDEYDLGKAIEEYEDGIRVLEFDNIEQFINDHPDDKICLLERSNINTRFIATKLKKKGIPNQCVINGLRDAYPKWIGAVFGGFTEESLSTEVLVQLFIKEGKLVEDALYCWRKIKELDRMDSEIIQMKHLLFKLLAHELDDVFYKLPKSNFLVSNIHRSKGLEYDYVLLDENVVKKARKPKSPDEYFEEARVLYVAMTRAKTETLKLVNPNLPNCKRKYGRYYKNKSIGNGQYKLVAMEVLQDSKKMDVGPNSFVVPDMKESQMIIRRLESDEEICLVYSAKDKKYAIVAQNKTIGWMNDTFNNAVNRYKNPPKRFEGLYVDGVYTYIGQPDKLTGFEEKARAYYPEIGVYKIWNYISFSGLAYAVYDD